MTVVTTATGLATTPETVDNLVEIAVDVPHHVLIRPATEGTVDQDRGIATDVTTDGPHQAEDIVIVAVTAVAIVIVDTEDLAADPTLAPTREDVNVMTQCNADLKDAVSSLVVLLKLLVNVGPARGDRDTKRRENSRSRDDPEQHHERVEEKSHKDQSYAGGAAREGGDAEVQ